MISGSDSEQARNLHDLCQLYRSALEEYLAGAGETALGCAYELGSKALADGAGVLDLAAIHRDCLLELGGAAQPDNGGSPKACRAFDFFAKSLAAYEAGLVRARREREEAARASRAKDEFLAILSHELRNPLMPVLGWIRILQKHRLIQRDITLREGVQALERNVQTIARLVGDCLDLTRIAQGKIHLERKLADLNQILRATCEAIREMARAKGIAVQVHPWPTPLWVWGDPTRLEQVVMNLLVNAVKYTAGNGAISAGCIQVGSDAEIQVADNGAGIEAEALEQIFEPFRQSTRTWLSSEAGLGLGLAIARTIVNMHDGRIWAESDGLGRGSTFRVRLSLAVPDRSQAKSEQCGLPPSGRARPLQILIVEDAQDILALMKMELEALGHSVLTAADGAQGLAVARERRPDLIISDIRMPGLDGFQLVRNIRATPDLAHTPAIALTGFGMQGDIQKLLAAGFDACVPKPAEIDQVHALIRNLTGDR